METFDARLCGHVGLGGALRQEGQVMDMLKTEIVTVRMTGEEKRRLITSARRRKKTVTALVKQRLAPDIADSSREKRRLPTAAERKVLERFIGAVRSPKRYRLTNEEIDRIVYGK
jgi:hypothetical protein